MKKEEKKSKITSQDSAKTREGSLATINNLQNVP